MRNKKVSIRGGLMRDMIHDIMETSLGKPYRQANSGRIQWNLPGSAVRL